MNKMLSNNDIDFYQKTNISTGETTGNESMEAKYNGLTIRISPEKSGNFWLVVRGSIHRFFNDGGTNDNDFFLWQFREALQRLETLLCTPINDFKIDNIEFGVNISTELTAAKYIKSLIYDGNKAFADLNINDTYIGKQSTREDTTLKIYDKGRQEQSDNKRLLRIELKFNRMRLLSDPQGKFKISSIGDLLTPEKLGVLGIELSERWGQTVFYDGCIDEKKLSPAELGRLWKFRSWQFWDELNRKNRYKARLKFEKMIAEKGNRQTQRDIQKMILLKWCELVNKQPQKGRRFTHFSNEKTAQEKATFDTVQYTRHLSPKSSKRKEEKNPNVLHEGKRLCPVCGKDISHMKKTALTCSRKCRNVKSGKARKERNMQLREYEKTKMKEIIATLETEPLKISIEQSTAKRLKRVFTNQIKPMKYKELRKITRVRGTCSKSGFEFTSYRAKEFIKYCFTNYYKI